MKYDDFIGKNKKEIIEKIGQQFNYYHAKHWTYTLGNDLLRRKKILFLYFEDDVVTKVEVKRKI